MSGINLVLWAAGVVLIALGYIRARGPYSRYQALKEQDANVARYEAWRGGVRDNSHDRRVGGDEDASTAGADRAVISVVGFVLVFLGFALR